jgi:hypothetical protein
MTDLSSGVAVKTVAKSKSLNLRWWYIGVPLLLITLIEQLDKMAISVVMSNKQFLQDLQLVGMLMSGFLLSYSIFHFFWGPFVKKFGLAESAGAMIATEALEELAGVSAPRYFIRRRCSQSMI